MVRVSFNERTLFSAEGIKASLIRRSRSLFYCYEHYYLPCNVAGKQREYIVIFMRILYTHNDLSALDKLVLFINYVYTLKDARDIKKSILHIKILIKFRNL